MSGFIYFFQGLNLPELNRTTYAGFLDKSATTSTRFLSRLVAIEKEQSDRNNP
jgi:hypothetical protein